LVLPYRNKLPRVAERAWVADNATLIGDIEVEDEANIWFGCILRGDVASIFVGARTNVQDGTIVHGATGQPRTHIGAGVTIGHMALIHACRLEDKCFIGMKACILDGAVVESGAMVAAGAVVPPGKRVTSGQLWGGTPARPMRDLTDKEKRYIEELPARYIGLSNEYRRPK
jgi:carbonic anhydrase/acetyltransferase-like protein (isoleucine patch superfamily)